MMQEMELSVTSTTKELGTSSVRIRSKRSDGVKIVAPINSKVSNCYEI